MEGGVIRVLIVAESALVRRGLETVLADRERFEVVGTESLHEAALEHAIEESGPDVVLLEWYREEEDLLPWLEANRDVPRPSIVVLAAAANRESIAGFLRAGVRAVLPLGASAEEIAAAVQAVAAGLVVFHPSELEQALPAPVAALRSANSALIQPLSSREREVLRLMADGLANKEIAARLGISGHTVKFHVSSIFNKLNVSSRTEAVTLGLRLGYVPL